MVIMSPRTFAKYYTLGNLFIIGRYVLQFTFFPLELPLLTYISLSSLLQHLLLDGSSAPVGQYVRSITIDRRVGVLWINGWNIICGSLSTIDPTDIGNGGCSIVRLGVVWQQLHSFRPKSSQVYGLHHPPFVTSSCLEICELVYMELKPKSSVVKTQQRLRARVFCFRCLRRRNNCQMNPRGKTTSKPSSCVHNTVHQLGTIPWATQESSTHYGYHERSTPTPHTVVVP